MNYLRSSLFLRYFSGEILCGIAGGSTTSVLPPAKNSPIPPRKMSHCAARPKPLSYPPCRRPACYFASEPDSFRAALRWWLLVCFPRSKSNFLTLSSVMSHSVPSRAILSLPEDGIKGTPYSLQVRKNAFDRTCFISSFLRTAR